ncbi:MAG: xanthine dehydrogenase family protein molybdopterin-binding subunit [Pseudomonadales bacterium]|jgi:CO/xanthine dehydrogenase Mo-binding subunit|nr:xanthine dehydrogenase family protein molybdopterin-binding subunit [Pseudomonadales bacterium]MDP6471225.1 xanthine dehydrogenase family protein molybdopterin-binding subunit [Pseudomonadales bacterium]MDP6825586.1 xanthine dehydrogenase family protein molybdopterin-binding subunit [Pseudomonadales bacterium]MDP6972953.1 xanthine dehydrogenase family protein molybdopterin-binding subunit [Pseudomonadales bacterium]
MPEFQTLGKRPLRPDAIDKVLGRAVFGADVSMGQMLQGAVLRSPHAHARILSIDTSKAERLSGVKAVITSADFPALRPRGPGDIARDNLAVDKVLYHGHGVAAVAATGIGIARAALDLIDVHYEPLPHVLSIDDAMAEGGVVLHPDLTHEGHEGPSNVYERVEQSIGDVEKGFEDADVIVERTYSTPTVHQGYIEPPACAASFQPHGQSTIWTTTQGHFTIRDSVALMCGLQTAELRVVPTEIGGGFGGKTTPYLEAMALTLSKNSGRPVKMRMTREEVFRCAGPGAASKSRVRIGARTDGTITAMDADLVYAGGAFPGAPLGGGMGCIFSSYDVPNVRILGRSVVVNKPMVRAYRGPGAPQACFASESLLNELATRLGMDALALREKNALRDGGSNIAGSFRELGLLACLEAAQDSSHYRTPLEPGRGRSVAVSFWRNAGGLSSATVVLHRNGFASVLTGSADLSGTRASLAMIAAETLGLPIENVHAEVADTESVGFTGVSGGSRTINATGQAVASAAQEAISQMKERAASEWNVRPDQVEWREGRAYNTTRDESLTLKEITRRAPQTGGVISASTSINPPGGEGPCFAVHICDVDVDRETGKTAIARYTTVQDAGMAVHPAYVEGQFQGGAVQGIGWALNEEYVYDSDGVLQNPGFLDYRMPVASDLPMIDTIIVEVPNSRHPFGVRGVGEAPIIPPLAAVASAIGNAVGVPMCDLPCTPERVLASIEAIVEKAP